MQTVKSYVSHSETSFWKDIKRGNIATDKTFLGWKLAGMTLRGGSVSFYQTQVNLVEPAWLWEIRNRKGTESGLGKLDLWVPIQNVNRSLSHVQPIGSIHVNMTLQMAPPGGKFATNAPIIQFMHILIFCLIFLQPALMAMLISTFDLTIIRQTKRILSYVPLLVVFSRVTGFESKRDTSGEN